MAWSRFCHDLHIVPASDRCRARSAAGSALPAGVRLPLLPAPPTDGTSCNDYLPSDSTLRRFLWVVAFYAANGFHVLLDNHWREDDTVLADPAAWAAKWAQLVRHDLPLGN